MINFVFKIINNAFYLGRYKLILLFLLIMLSTAIELLGISLIIPIISIFIEPDYINKFNFFEKISFLENFNSLNFLLILFFFLIFI